MAAFRDFVCDENNQLIIEENEGEILCYIVDEEGISRHGLGSRQHMNSIFLGKNGVAPVNKQILINSNLLKDEPCLEETLAEESTEWGEEMTRMLLDKYQEYMAEVGPMKTFKTKKKMWECISTAINQTFNVKKNPQQVENRFKTILKRKKRQLMRII